MNNAHKARSPDYEELRTILQKELGKSVDYATARKIGQWLLRLYSHLSVK